MKKSITPILLALLLNTAPAFSESQNGDYQGITDPFGDPANVEFAEDEKEDKEFFHLGRFLMVGVDLGMGVFTGGLGSSNSPGFAVGGRFIYFFDRALGLEAAVHTSSHVDAIRSTGVSADIDTSLMPVTAGVRYYFDTKSAPRALALANPYVVAGAGLYIRNQTVTASTGTVSATNGATNNFGGFVGAGVEFLIYRRHIYLGADLRYHLVFFDDEDATFGNSLELGARSGDYFNAVISLTYNF